MTLLLVVLTFLKHPALLLPLALHVHLPHPPIPNGVLSMKQETIHLTSVSPYTVLNVISLFPGLTHLRRSFAPGSKKSRLTSETPPQQQQIHSSIPSIVAPFSPISMLTAKFMLNQLTISAGVDTGASLAFLSESAYSSLKLKFPDIPLELQKSNITLSSVQGSTLYVTGTVTLQISLAPSSKIFNIHFHVTPRFALPSDGLLGLDSLIAHDISVHPKRRAVLSVECFHPAMDANFPFLSSISSITPCGDQRLSTPVNSAPLPGSSEEKSSSSEPWAVSAVATGDQYIGPSCAISLSVHLKNAPVGSHVISTPEPMRIYR